MRLRIVMTNHEATHATWPCPWCERGCDTRKQVWKHIHYHHLRPKPTLEEKEQTVALYVHAGNKRQHSDDDDETSSLVVPHGFILYKATRIDLQRTCKPTKTRLDLKGSSFTAFSLVNFMPKAIDDEDDDIDDTDDTDDTDVTAEDNPDEYRQGRSKGPPSIAREWSFEQGFTDELRDAISKRNQDFINTFQGDLQILPEQGTQTKAIARTV